MARKSLPVQVFKVQLAIGGDRVLIYNQDRSIFLEDDATRYEDNFVARLRRTGKAYVVMRVNKDGLHFLGYADDKGW